MHFPYRTHILLLLSLLVVAPSITLQAQEKSTTRVGVLLPLSGEFAAWGLGIRRAIELVAAEIPNEFSFTFQDEGNCEAQKSVSGYRSLRLSGAHYFIVGCLAGTKAILPLAKKDSALFLSAGLVDDATFENTSQLINLATQLSTESGYLAKRIAERGFKHVAIMHWIDPFSNEFADSLAIALERNSSKAIIKEGLDPRANDYRSILLKIKSANPDALSFNIGQDQQDVLLRQIRQLGIDIPVFSNYVFETPPVLKLGDVASKVEYTFPLNSSDGTSDKLAFDKSFEAKFGAGEKPTPNSYFVKDGLEILKKALSKCPKNDTNCVGNFFKTTQNFEGLSGNISFRPNGSNNRPYGIKAVKNGEFVWVMNPTTSASPNKFFR